MLRRHGLLRHGLLLALVQGLAPAGAGCKVTLYPDAECDEASAAWPLSAEVDSGDWCESACGQQFGRGSCTAARTWLDQAAEVVAEADDEESDAHGNERVLASFQQLGGDHVACRGPGGMSGTSAANLAEYSDSTRTCTSPVADREACEATCSSISSASDEPARPPSIGMFLAGVGTFVGPVRCGEAARAAGPYPPFNFSMFVCRKFMFVSFVLIFDS